MTDLLTIVVLAMVLLLVFLHLVLEEVRLVHCPHKVLVQVSHGAEDGIPP